MSFSTSVCVRSGGIKNENPWTLLAGCGDVDARLFGVAISTAAFSGPGVLGSGVLGPEQGGVS